MNAFEVGVVEGAFEEIGTETMTLLYDALATYLTYIPSSGGPPRDALKDALLIFIGRGIEGT